MAITFQDARECCREVAKGVLTTGLCWCFCCWGLSYAWILIAVFCYSLRQIYVERKRKRIAAGQVLYTREQEIILARLSELPNWVFFPDVEKAEWINKIVLHIWPSVKEYCKLYMLGTLQPVIASYLPKKFAAFRFLSVYLGDLPPRIGGVKVYDNLSKKNEIVTDVDIYYAGNARIDMSIGPAAAGIEDLKLKGTLRVVMKPLLDDIPFVGGLTIFFLQPPTFEYNLTNMGNILEVPFLESLVKDAVSNVIAKRMVAPHKMSFVLSPKTDGMELRQTMPDGIVRLQVVGAKDLAAKDLHLLAKYRLSDPYAKIRCGEFSGKTRVINGTLNPQWDQSFEFIVDQKFAEFINIDLFDEDIGSKDDPLGNASLSVEDLASRGTITEWLTLEGGPGAVYVEARWFTPSSDLKDIVEAQPASPDFESSLITALRAIEEDNFASCLLLVFVDSARNLQSLDKSRKGMAGAAAMVTVAVGSTVRTTDPAYDMINPQWRQSLYFLVRQPHLEDVKLRVMDTRRQDLPNLGTLVVPLKDLLSLPGMARSGSHVLKDQGGQSELVLRFALKVLRPPSKVSSSRSTPTPDAGFSKTPTTNGTPTGSVGAGASGAMGADVMLSGWPLVDSSTPIQSDSVSMTRSVSGNGFKRNGTLRMSELRRRAVALSDHSTALGDHVGLGKIQLTLRYSTQRSRLIVVVHTCIDLVSQGTDSVASTYISICFVHTLPSKAPREKKKTQVIKNSVNPTFDETFEFAVSPKDVVASNVEITVKNRLSTFTRLTLGHLLIRLSENDVSQPSTKWYNLQSTP